jgi:hypothetical protein
VAATDAGSPAQRAVVSVTVNVLDENDNAPIIEPLSVAEVSENAMNGTEVARVSAFDLDAFSNAEIRYSLVESLPGLLPFRIVPETGRVFTTGPLDRESQSAYQVAFEATDGLFTTRDSLMISVLDVNDNAPVFEALQALSVAESLTGAIGSIGLVSDQDQGSNSAITLSVVSSVPPDSFAIADNGTLRVVRALDREAVDTATMVIEAADGGLPSLSSRITLNVSVLDVNDNAPQLVDPPLLIFVPEDVALGDSVGFLTAVDADLGDNGRVRFQINNTVPFALHETTGELRAVGPLDAESRTNYLLEVVVHDLGTPRLATRTTIPVRVTNVNDNAPVFVPDEPVVRRSFPQTEPLGFLVLTLNARDADGDAVTFSLDATEGAQLFRLDETSGALRYVQEDRANGDKTYTLTVTARDSGRPVLTATLTLEITILFVDREAPRLTLAAQEPVTFREGTAPVQLVTSPVLLEENSGFLQVLEARILNRLDGAAERLSVNSSLLSATSEDDGVLRAESTQGAVSLAAMRTAIDSITYENTAEEPTMGQRNVSLLVSDGQFESTAVQLVVAIELINDNAPVIRNVPSELTISEDTQLFLSLFTAVATDLDAGLDATVRFSLDTASQGQFAVDDLTGEFLVASPLDAESMQQFNVTLIAQDLGSPPLASNVTFAVLVSDENDLIPRIASTTISVSETSTVGSAIGQMTVEDADVTAVNRISQVGFVNPNGPAAVYFDLNASTGVVYLRRTLDREIVGAELVAEVFVTNDAPPRLSSTTLVTFLVEDANDNAPIFNELSPLSVNEMAPVGERVAFVTATDLDSGTNGQVVYTLLETPDAAFVSLNQSTGELTLAQRVDFETKALLALSVVATDEGAPPLRAILNITLSVIDANDNLPVFTLPTYNANISELASGDTFIATVQATDADTGPNGLIRYSLEGPTSALFAIDAISGVVRTAPSAALDREALAVHVLTVVAQDQGSPPNTATTMVRVELLDVNDNAPFVDTLSTDTLDNSSVAVTFRAGGASVAICPQPAIRDRDSITVLSQIQLMLQSPPDGEQESLLAFVTAGSNVTLVRRQDGQAFTLLGPATPDDFARVVGTIRYVNTATTATPGARVISIQALDGVNGVGTTQALVSVDSRGRRARRRSWPARATANEGPVLPAGEDPHAQAEEASGRGALSMFALYAALVVVLLFGVLLAVLWSKRRRGALREILLA